jgi:acyl-CoA ligase (AMP-forming) (exosortase A-associated)
MNLLHDLIQSTADRFDDRPALTFGRETLKYGALANHVSRFAGGLMALGLARSERVAVYLEKREETVVCAFGASEAGCVFVPINPLLKPDQVAYIMRDCNVRVLVTSAERWALLETSLNACDELRHVVLTAPFDQSLLNQRTIHNWGNLLEAPRRTGHRVIDMDMAAIFYTSGSTGKPKGVVLSHRNLVMGAQSVASYLENTSADTLLAALPLSFDAGFSQLTTAFYSGARVVLINYLLPKDVINALVSERVTGLTAVPPLYIQLAQLPWPAPIAGHLRYFANTGGHMPLATLNALRAKLPTTKPFLMYGLTEAFRSTYLPPEEVDRRPDSIGKAIPNAEILVLREDGTPCSPNEPGELVHRGALVAMGYWDDPEKTAERYKPVPGRERGFILPEIAVFSGDTVRMDEDGFIYFIGRRDEMIKTSGYRVSPTEIEEAIHSTQLVGEVAAFGVPHPTLGQGIVVVATPASPTPVDEAMLLSACRTRLPAFMVPAKIQLRPGPLPRNPNGKIDRKTISIEFQELFSPKDPATPMEKPR